MPGLHERLSPLFDDDIGRVSAHWITASFEARLARICDSPKGASINAVKNSISQELAESNLLTLRAEDEADLDAIDAVLLGLPDCATQVAYVGTIRYASLGAEIGQLTDSKWRTDLGIS